MIHRASSLHSDPPNKATIISSSHTMANTQARIHHPCSGRVQTPSLSTLPPNSLGVQHPYTAPFPSLQHPSILHNPLGGSPSLAAMHSPCPSRVPNSPPPQCEPPYSVRRHLLPVPNLPWTWHNSPSSPHGTLCSTPQRPSSTSSARPSGCSIPPRVPLRTSRQSRVEHTTPGHLHELHRATGVVREIRRQWSCPPQAVSLFLPFSLSVYFHVA